MNRAYWIKKIISFCWADSRRTYIYSSTYPPPARIICQKELW